MKEAEILSIQVGLPKTFNGTNANCTGEKPWTTGIFKTAVYGPVWLSKLNLAGDGQADLSVHGGEHKVINVYPSEHYLSWRQELHLPDLPYGAFGENFTTCGLLENEVCIGDVFRVGEAVVQVSQPRQPCWKLERRLGIDGFIILVKQTGRIGWYFRVMQEGYVEAGNMFFLVERPHPQWTVATAYSIMSNRKSDIESAHALARCPALAPRWQENLIMAK